MRARLARLTIHALRLAGGRLCILAFVLLSAGWLYTAPNVIYQHAHESPFTVDYLSFDAAATLVRDGRADDLYDPGAQRAVQGKRAGDDAGSQYYVYLYPPVVAGAFTPLAALPIHRGFVVYTLILSGALMAVAALLWKAARDLNSRARSVFIVCTVGSTAFCSSLVIGQLTPLLLVVALAGFLLFVRGRPLSAGLLLGLLVIKPHFCLAALFVMMLTRQRKAAAASLLTALALGGASVWIVGVDGAQSYVSATLDAAQSPTVAGVSLSGEQSVYGIAATVFGIRGGIAVSAVHVLIAGIAVLLTLRAVRNATYAGDERARYFAGLAALLVITASPHIQYYDLALVVFPALFIVVRTATAANHELRRCLVGLLVCVLAILEIAGILASAKLSVSAPVLLGFTLLYCNWPKFEEYLATRTATSEREASGAQPRLAA